MALHKGTITLAELAAEKLSARLIMAIAATTVEVQRRNVMETAIPQVAPAGNMPAAETTLPVVVLGEMVIMPGIPVFLVISSKGGSYRAIEEAMKGDHEVLVIFVSEAEIEGFKGNEPQQLPQVGVIGRIEHFWKRPDATVQIILTGVARAQIIARVAYTPFYRATCVPRPDAEIESSEAKTLMSQVKSQVEAVVKATPSLTQDASETVEWVNQITQPGRLADTVIFGPAFSFEERLDILRTINPMERLHKMQHKLLRLDTA